MSTFLVIGQDRMKESVNSVGTDSRRKKPNPPPSKPSALKHIIIKIILTVSALGVEYSNNLR